MVAASPDPKPSLLSTPAPRDGAPSGLRRPPVVRAVSAPIEDEEDDALKVGHRTASQRSHRRPSMSYLDGLTSVPAFAPWNRRPTAAMVPPGDGGNKEEGGALFAPHVDVTQQRQAAAAPIADARSSSAMSPAAVSSSHPPPRSASAFPMVLLTDSSDDGQDLL